MRILLFVAVGILSSQFVHAQNQSENTFKAPGQIANHPKTVPTLSQDKEAITHKLEDMDVEINAKDRVASDQESITIWSPVTKSDCPIKIRQVVAGSVINGEKISASLTIHGHGKLKTYDLSQIDDDFKFEVVFTVPAGEDFVVTYMLNVHANRSKERRQAFATLDFVELTTKEIAASTSKK